MLNPFLGLPIYAVLGVWIVSGNTIRPCHVQQGSSDLSRCYQKSVWLR
jgi:hypothetical protein